MADEEDYYGDSCYFHRDLSVGAYGGDVSCLQQYLHHEGFLQEEASGYFGLATKDAVTRWQATNQLLPARGVLGYSSRLAYAKRHQLPSTEQLRAMEHQSEVSEKKGVFEYCAQLERVEVCQTKRVIIDAPFEDRRHLCNEACQMATSEACDKAFPSNQSLAFKRCLQLVPKNCKKSCDGCTRR